MHIELYTSLTGAGIPADRADALVKALEGHIQMTVNQAIQPLAHKIDLASAAAEARHQELAAKLDGLAYIKSEAEKEKALRVARFRWVLTSAVSTAVMVITAGYGALKYFGILP